MVGKAALVPKGPSAPTPPPPRDPAFDRDLLLVRLFALPVPPAPSARRTYPITTPLGRIMRLRGLTIAEVAGREGRPDTRVMSDYLADRKPVAPHHRVALARYLKVDSRIF